MKDAKRGLFDVVLVWRFDRFARSIEQLVLAEGVAATCRRTRQQFGIGVGQLCAVSERSSRL